MDRRSTTGAAEVGTGTFKGTVYLVGAGPGDPGLLTRRGSRLLRRADVVVHDALVSREILDLIHPRAVLVDVGKRCGGRKTSQQEINELLVRWAREARIVVRLKGGDPFVFGRGGEEALALAEAGVRFAVVPGVTAAVGVAAYAGIPLTHRDLSSSITFLTGHEQAHGAGQRIDWNALADLGGTLVVYMGVGTLDNTTSSLLAAGARPDTPAAVIEWGTFARQRTVTSSLAEISLKARENAISAPALIVIGAVVALRPSLGWFDRLPLRGRRVVVIRTRPQPSRVARALRSLGAEVADYPKLTSSAIVSASIPETISRLCDYDWLMFASVVAVDRFWLALRRDGLDARAMAGLKVAALGRATAAALARRGIVSDVALRTFQAEVVVAKLVHAGGEGHRVLFPRETPSASAVAVSLRAAGYTVDELEVAAVTAADADAQSDAPLDTDLIVLPSSSSARFLARVRRQIGPRTRVLAIGPNTAQTALACGLPIHGVADRASVDGIMGAALAMFGADSADIDARGETIPSVAPASLVGVTAADP